MYWQSLQINIPLRRDSKPSNIVSLDLPLPLIPSNLPVVTTYSIFFPPGDMSKETNYHLLDLRILIFAFPLQIFRPNCCNLPTGLVYDCIVLTKAPACHYHSGSIPCDPYNGAHPLYLNTPLIIHSGWLDSATTPLDNRQDECVIQHGQQSLLQLCQGQGCNLNSMLQVV